MMPEDASYTIDERQTIRRAAETTMEALGLSQGQVTRVEAESCLALLELLFKAKVPLNAECYDLSSFDIASLSYSKPNLLRLGNNEQEQRVFEIEAGLVMILPETIGQAPVIYLASKARPIQPHLYLNEMQLNEWSRPIQFHQALIKQDNVVYDPEEIIAHKRAEMQDEQEPLPELLSFISAGIALAIHVAPRQFSYRFPELAISQIAHWPLGELQETLEDVIERLIRNKEAGMEF